MINPWCCKVLSPDSIGSRHDSVGSRAHDVISQITLSHSSFTLFHLFQHCPDVIRSTQDFFLVLIHFIYARVCSLKQHVHAYMPIFWTLSRVQLDVPLNGVNIFPTGNASSFSICTQNGTKTFLMRKVSVELSDWFEVTGGLQ